MEDIDVSTIKLNDQVPAESRPTGIGDCDDDGIAELMVKFDISAVQEILEAGDEVEITVTGELNDDTTFEGSDTIRVKKNTVLSRDFESKVVGSKPSPAMNLRPR